MLVSRLKDPLVIAALASGLVHLALAISWVTDQSSFNSTAHRDSVRYHVALNYQSQKKRETPDHSDFMQHEETIEQWDEAAPIEQASEVSDVVVDIDDTGNEIATQIDTVVEPVMDDTPSAGDAVSELDAIPEEELDEFEMAQTALSMIEQLAQPAAGEKPTEDSEVVEDSGEVDQLLADYVAELQAWVAEHQRYPRKARLKGYEGRVLLNLSIDFVGSSHTKIIDSSGYAVLDKAAQNVFAVRNIPPPPEELRSRGLSFDLPVLFALN